MGRLPSHFAGRQINFRRPYIIYADADRPASTNGYIFPEASWLVAEDKPFEIHRCIIRLTAKDSEGNILEPQPTTLDKRVRVRILDFSKNEMLTKNATLVGAMFKQNEYVWEWDDPYTLVRSEGFQVQVDTDAFPSVCNLVACEPISTPVTLVRVEVAFEGFSLFIAPATESR